MAEAKRFKSIFWLDGIARAVSHQSHMLEILTCHSKEGDKLFSQICSEIRTQGKSRPSSYAPQLRT
eukprot:3783865-Amphidinium_carterae.1